MIINLKALFLLLIRRYKDYLERSNEALRVEQRKKYYYNIVCIYSSFYFDVASFLHRILKNDEKLTCLVIPMDYLSLCYSAEKGIKLHNNNLVFVYRTHYEYGSNITAAETARLIKKDLWVHGQINNFTINDVVVKFSADHVAYIAVFVRKLK